MEKFLVLQKKKTIYKKFQVLSKVQKETIKAPYPASIIEKNGVRLLFMVIKHTWKQSTLPVLLSK